MTSGALDLRAGQRPWFDGGSWTVCEVSAAAVRLRDDRGSYRSAAVAELIDAAAGFDDTVVEETVVEYVLPSVALASLTSRQRRVVDKQVEVLAPLLTQVGMDDAGVTDRIERAAQQLGASSRTVRRRLRRLEELGRRAWWMSGS